MDEFIQESGATHSLSTFLSFLSLFSNKQDGIYSLEILN